VFLFTILANIDGCNLIPIKHEGNLKALSIKYNNKRLQFKDSLLLLPSSLKELGLSFNCTTQKEMFPVLFNNYNYIGPIPDFKYFVNIELNDYNTHFSEYLNNNKIWNFKEESIKYCINDCVVLHEILCKFNELIYKLYKLNINDYLTLPSLTVAMFRSKYLIENTIPGLAGEIFNDIKQSYTGGAVDMYIPSNESNEMVFAYDVNSLFPSIMLNNPMPVGKPVYFQGDIRKFDPNAFGFFYAEVKSPGHLDHPIIQLHHKVDNAIRTISPLGSFKMMIFSEEMYNAEKHGYTFNVLWGYTFDKGFIFKDFVNDLYDLRLQFSKPDPMNYIAKLLMNSLYGRFAMSDHFNEIQIIDGNKYKSFENKNINKIVEVTQLGNKSIILILNIINTDIICLYI
jgi:hypothetical protein